MLCGISCGTAFVDAVVKKQVMLALRSATWAEAVAADEVVFTPRGGVATPA